MVLSAAAVCGVEFRVDTISGALERDAVWVGQTCDELAREQMWLVAPRAEGGSNAAELPYSFRHALFRQVLYERTAPSVRAQLHRKVGAALERERARGVPVAAAELAMHFERAANRWPRCATTSKPPKPRSRTSARDECMSITERALTLARAGAGGRRARCAGDRPRDASRCCRYPTCLASSAEAKSAFQRAYALLAEVPEHPMRRAPAARVRVRAWPARRTMPRRSRWRTEREALSSATNDPVLLLDRVHRAWAGRSASGPIARGSAHGSSAGSRSRSVSTGAG